jgi:creatinine amidohydrolase
MERPWILGDTPWPLAEYAVAVLPWGATEAHNRHLPYGTDTIETEHVANQAARIAWEQGARVVVLPPVPFGVNTGQLDIPLCINLNPSTQAAVLRDIVASVELARIRKLVIVNGHGGNDFRQMIRELQPATDVFLCTTNWYTCIDPVPFFTEPGDHAGELETSIMQHLAPGLVRPLSDAGDGRAKPFRVQALREGWAWAPRHWIEVTTDTGVGNPRAASPDKGAQYFKAVTGKLAGFLRELAAADLDMMYGE